MLRSHPVANAERLRTRRLATRSSGGSTTRGVEAVVVTHQLEPTAIRAVTRHEIGTRRLPPVELHLIPGRIAKVGPLPSGARSDVARARRSQSGDEFLGTRMLGALRVIEGNRCGDRALDRATNSSRWNGLRSTAQDAFGLKAADRSAHGLVGDVLERRDLVALVAEDGGHHLADVTIVVDDEDAGGTAVGSCRHRTPFGAIICDG